MPDLLRDDEKREVLFLVIAGLSLAASFFGVFEFPFDVAWIAVLLCGIPIIKEASEALVSDFDIKANVLVSLALIASVLIGEVFAAGEIAFIMTIGEMLEGHTVAKARAGIEKLVHLTPRTARVIHGGEEKIIPAEEVAVGDILRVLAGETIAVDGVITEGETSINQSVMTGESLPVDKGAGDEVSSGTVNQFGTFTMRAAKVGEDSALQRMIRLVESADAGKAKIAGIADRTATWIVVIALLSAGITWYVTGEIIRAVTILVVFCPCALVLATPTAIMAGIGNATRYGILVREGDALERLSSVTHIAFDKTGTLTYGKPTVAAVESFSDDITSGELLKLTSSAERRSEHPLGMAVLDHYRKNFAALPPEPQEFSMSAGRGVRAKVDGRDICAGNTQLFAECAIDIPPAMNERAEELRSDGSTVILVAADGRAAGFIALSDEIRTDAQGVIRAIDEIGVRPVLLTGDNSHAADRIARIAGIDEVYSNCLPETKMERITKLQSEGKPVCMVGDGVNDAPALRVSHVGIAMGGIGSDIAIEAADIALVGDDIKVLPHLIRLAKKTMGTIKMNLALSLLLNFIAIILAMLGILNPVWGALVHNAGSVAVVLNSTLLLGWRRV